MKRNEGPRGVVKTSGGRKGSIGGRREGERWGRTDRRVGADDRARGFVRSLGVRARARRDVAARDRTSRTRGDESLARTVLNLLPRRPLPEHLAEVPFQLRDGLGRGGRHDGRLRRGARSRLSTRPRRRRRRRAIARRPRVPPLRDPTRVPATRGRSDARAGGSVAVGAARRSVGPPPPTPGKRRPLRADDGAFRATQFPTRARRALGVSFGIRSATSARSPRALIAGCDRALPFKNQTGFSSSVVGRVWLARARARAKKIS